MKKQKLPGENISLKTKKNESSAVMDWINGQTNLMDSIRYLIENEIRLNGVRNLQHFVPAERPSVHIPFVGANPEVAAAASEPVSTSVPAVVPEAEPPEREAENEIDDEDIESWL